MNDQTEFCRHLEWDHYGLGFVRSHEDIILELWPELWNVRKAFEMFCLLSIKNNNNKTVAIATHGGSKMDVVIEMP